MTTRQILGFLRRFPREFLSYDFAMVIAAMGTNSWTSCHGRGHSKALIYSLKSF